LLPPENHIVKADRVLRYAHISIVKSPVPKLKLLEVALIYWFAVPVKYILPDPLVLTVGEVDPPVVRAA
jgi:hypothetical protein